MTDNNSPFWSFDNNYEVFPASDIDEQIDSYLDSFDDKDVPTTIVLRGMRPMIPSVDEFLSFRMSPMYHLIDCWEETYFNPSGREITITEKMKEIEREFVAKILIELQPFVCACGPSGEMREIDVLQWAHRVGNEGIVRILEARKV